MNNSMTALQEVFNDRIIITGLCPICDFYLWGNIKGKIYRNNPSTAKAPQKEIRDVNASIKVDELQHVLQGFLQ
jgi:hypothetical protein